MVCSSCQHENPKEAKFCNACGAKREAVCPQCGHKNPPGSRFCNECGFSLAQIPSRAVERQLASLPSCTPKHLGEKILTFRSALEGERRQIGVMALLGAPIAREDSPRRAAHAALGIRRAPGDCSKELQAQRGLSLQMRLGLNTEAVFVTGEAEALKAAGHVLGAEQFPRELKEALVEKEVTKTLVDLGILRQDGRGYRVVKSLTEVGVPETIQGIVMAWLDRLGEEGKRTVQLASAIGRRFLQRLLERIAGVSWFRPGKRQSGPMRIGGPSLTISGRWRFVSGWVGVEASYRTGDPEIIRNAVINLIRGDGVRSG